MVKTQGKNHVRLWSAGERPSLLQGERGLAQHHSRGSHRQLRDQQEAVTAG